MAIKFAPIGFSRVCFVSCVLYAGSLLAQDRTPAIIAGGNDQQSSAHVGHTMMVPSSREYATALLANYDLVALGVFGDFPPSEPDLFKSLAPGETKLRFKIEKLYKGSAVDSIEISLDRDMLIYAGESISRYAKRQRVRRNQISAASDFGREFAQLEERLGTGAITKQQYDDQFARLKIGKDKLVRESLATSIRTITVIDGITFYDLGGAISPDRKFLIGVNRSVEHVNIYALEEVPTKATNIFWGQVLEDVSRALDTTARNISR
jgi:hypothetical protein